MKRQREDECPIPMKKRRESVPKPKCPICFETPRVLVASLDCCSHRFCRECISKWVPPTGGGKNCPVCRAPIHDVRFTSDDGGTCEPIHVADHVAAIAPREIAGIRVGEEAGRGGTQIVIRGNGVTLSYGRGGFDITRLFGGSGTTTIGRATVGGRVVAPGQYTNADGGMVVIGGRAPEEAPSVLQTAEAASIEQENGELSPENCEKIIRMLRAAPRDDAKLNILKSLLRGKSVVPSQVIKLLSPFARDDWKLEALKVMPIEWGSITSGAKVMRIFSRDDWKFQAMDTMSTGWTDVRVVDAVKLVRLFARDDWKNKALKSLKVRWADVTVAQVMRLLRLFARDDWKLEALKGMAIQWGNVTVVQVVRLLRLFSRDDWKLAAVKVMPIQGTVSQKLRIGTVFARSDYKAEYVKFLTRQ